MRKQVTRSAVLALDRVLGALQSELIEASDEEVRAAARELGMQPDMPGSAAFFGLKFPVRPRLEDFFDPEEFRKAQAIMNAMAGAARIRVAQPPAAPAPRTRRRKTRPYILKKPDR